MNEWRCRMFGESIFGAVCLLLLLFASGAAFAQIPPEAAKYRRLVTANSRLVWGLSAPVPIFMAQLQQESSFQADAKSAVGAQGLAQFMPATATWIVTVYPELVTASPLDPAWAVRAMVTYDKHLYDRITATDPCHTWAKVLSAYNGGLGYVYNDEILAAKQGLDWQLWWGNVESVKTVGRSASNWAENRGYPKRILLTLAPRYVSAGWGVSPCLV